MVFISWYVGHNVIVFQVLDHDELTFPYDQTTRFIGLESDEDIVVDAARLRQDYLDALSGLIDRYRVSLGNVGVDHILVDTSEPVGTILSSYLASRSQSQL